MDPATYLRTVADRWAAEPDLWNHYAETPGDTRNMLRDMADQIEAGTYYLP